MSAPVPPPNPYVGPRAFEEGEQARFFGRDRELEKLLNLLIARRLVLLYAPSGAGKTSLIQAALIPRLRDEGFLVRRIVRVSAALPAELASLAPNRDLLSTLLNLEAAPLAPNRYLLSTLLNLDEELPPAERTPPTELARTSLTDYLDRRRGADDVDEVLIFDQFEELLTLDSSDRLAKEAFLAELGAALQHPRRWALFAIREDYYGSLRPWLLPLPTRLDTVFQLGLLDPSRAMQAIQEPAREAGVSFDDNVARALVDDLRQAMVQRPDGSSEAVRGEAIEPVQLQVVCYRLWERKFAEGSAPTTITGDDLEQAGDVDTALQSYYAARVAAIATATCVSERRIRDWAEGQLITSAGLRGQLLREREATGGLPNTAVLALVDAHLVRAEERRGATWYELAHDRLVGPVQADNGAWRAANLTALQRQATLWDEQGRREGQLLRGEALAKAEAETDEGTLSEVERAFLAACREVQVAEERERRQSRRIRLLAWVATLVSIVALGMAGVAFAFSVQAAQSASSARTAEAVAKSAADQAETAQAIAESQQRVSDSQRLAFAAQSQAEQQPATALLLAYEAIARDSNAITSDALRQTLEWPTRVLTTLEGHSDSVNSASYSPDGRQVVTASSDGMAIIWDAESGARLTTLQGHSDSVNSASYSPDGSRVVTTSDDRTAIIWDTGIRARLTTLTGHSGPVLRASYSPDGRRVVTASDDQTAMIWDAGSGERLTTFQGHSGRVWSASYSPDGNRVVTASTDGTAIIWDAGNGEGLTTLQGHRGAVYRARYSPDGRRLVTASYDQTANIWDAESGARLTTFQGHSASVFSASYSPDGSRVVTASEDRTAIIWDAGSGKQLTMLQGHSGFVISASYSPDGRRVVSASYDQTAIIWDARSGEQLTTLRGHSKEVYSASYSPDGRRVVTASDDQTAIIWDAVSGEQLTTLQGHSGAIWSASYSPDGRRVVTASDDQTAIIWDAENGRRLTTLRDHTGTVYSASYSPDGSRVVTASEDATAIIWDAASGERLTTLQGHTDKVLSAIYSPDGSRVLTASSDGTARQYIAREADLVREAGCWIWRDLTADEIQRFNVPEPLASPTRNRDCPAR